MPNQDMNMEERIARIAVVSLGPEKTDDRRPIYVEGVGYVGEVHAQDKTLVIEKPRAQSAYDIFLRSLTERGIPYREVDKQEPEPTRDIVRSPRKPATLRSMFQIFSVGEKPLT